MNIMNYQALLNLLTTTQDPQSWMQFLPIVLIIVVFYFFMIRPNMKRQKDLAAYRNSLKKGDKIVTTGGIYGKVDEVKEQCIIMEIAPNLTIKVDKVAVIKDMTDTLK